MAYNDIPSYEVIDEGITALTIDWSLMGDKAADFILYNTPMQEFLPTEIRLRNSFVIFYQTVSTDQHRIYYLIYTKQYNYEKVFKNWNSSTIDGRQGGVREGLEEKTMNLAKRRLPN